MDVDWMFFQFMSEILFDFVTKKFTQIEAMARMIEPSG